MTTTLDSLTVVRNGTIDADEAFTLAAKVVIARVHEFPTLTHSYTLTNTRKPKPPNYQQNPYPTYASERITIRGQVHKLIIVVDSIMVDGKPRKPHTTTALSHVGKRYRDMKADAKGFGIPLARLILNEIKVAGEIDAA